MKRFFRRKKKKSSDGASLLLFLSLVIGGILLTVLTQFDGQSKKTVSEAPYESPDFASVLPAGSADEAKNVELVDSDTPTYAAAYMKDGTAYLGLVVWDKMDGRYELASTVALGSGEERLLGVGSLSVQRPGTGIPTFIVVRGPRSGSFPEGAVIALREGSSIRLAQKKDENGDVSDATFPIGRSSMIETDLSFKDVDGNGTLEATASHSQSVPEGLAPPTVTMSVYVWKDGKLAYDEQLSWAMTMDKHLFPEPTAPPEPVQ